RLAGGTIAIAQHEIGAMATLFALAVGRHRVAVDVPDEPQLTMCALARLVEHAMVGSVAALEPGQELVDTKLPVVYLNAGPDDPAHQTEAGPRLVRRHQRRRPGTVNQRRIKIIDRPVRVEIATRKHRPDQ